MLGRRTDAVAVTAALALLPRQRGLSHSILLAFYFEEDGLRRRHRVAKLPQGCNFACYTGGWLRLGLSIN